MSISQVQSCSVFSLAVLQLTLVTAQFSDLLEATGVYKVGRGSVKRLQSYLMYSQEGAGRPGAATTFRPSFNDAELRDMVAVGLISQELSKKLTRSKLEKLAHQDYSNLERANEVETEAEGKAGVATRRYELMKDEFDDEFMSRSANNVFLSSD